MPSNNAQPKSSGLGIAVVLLLLIIGGAVAGLHFTGKLQPILDIVMGTDKGDETPLPPTVVIVPTPDKPKMPDPDITTTPDTTVVDNTVDNTVDQVPLTEEEKLIESYRKRFKAPVVGKPISVELKSKSKLSGTLTYIDENSLKIKNAKIVEMTLARSQLGPKGLARCYEDEYVKYMMARNKNLAQAADIRKQRDAKLNASYAKFMASKGKKVEVASKKPTKQSIQDMDFKKWMEENGQTEALKARQERIRAYEAEKRAAASRAK